MKNSLLALASLCLLVPLVHGAQNAPTNTSRIGDFILNWRSGTIEIVGPTPSGKVTATLLGNAAPVAMVSQEAGSEALKKAKLKSRRRELSAKKIVAVAVNVSVKGKKAFVSGATLTANVSILLEQLDLEGNKQTIKVRCDEAIFKAGTKPGMGRIDFSGNAHLWSYGALDTETSVDSGWIDLGDPEDAENKPPTLHLGAGSTTGNIKEEPEKKKK
jgi:hypothetical protein